MQKQRLQVTLVTPHILSPPGLTPPLPLPLQVFPKDDGKLNNVQKKGLSILLWVKRERRYTAAVTVRPEAERTWTGDAAADNWDRILDFGGHCDAAASCAAADNVILSFANGMTYEVWRGDKTFPEARQRLSVNLPFPPGEWVHVAVLHDMTENTAFILSLIHI